MSSANLGERFGKLVVLAQERGTDGRLWFRCRCDCGTEMRAHAKDIRRGHTKSCGCARVDHGRLNRRHGHTTDGKWSPTYRVWHFMKHRCENSKSPAYSAYGGRGIFVCERWSASFQAFLDDMGEKPAGLSIDRIDNNKGYGPENCRWADGVTQSNNRRTSKLVTLNGVTKSLTQWSREVGIGYSTVLERIKRGWSAEKALSTEVHHESRNHRFDVIRNRVPVAEH